jgi:hypothetical protein
MEHYIAYSIIFAFFGETKVLNDFRGGVARPLRTEIFHNWERQNWSFFDKFF